MDSFDRAVFSAPFEPANLEFREIFKPFTYKPVVITVGGTPIFTGTMMLPLPSLQPSAKSVRVSCYSQPGVSDDCTAPASAFPIEFNKQGLKEIAQTLLEPFGIPVEFEADQGAVFERVALEPGKKIFSFLIELAQQRNLVIRSTPLGAVAFIRSIATGSPVVQLEQGFSPLLGVEPNFNPQKYHSHITGIDPAAIGSKGSQYTVPNPRLEGVVRPLTFKAKDTDNGSIKAAVEAKAARMFADAASYSIQLDTWRDPAGNLWEPNTSLNLLAPGAMIYNNYEFLVRTVELEADRQSRTATHNLVMPGVFSGQIPESLPWDE
jgi:prophage tail gpP-like protein